MRLIDADALCKILERRIAFRNKCLKENPPQDFIAKNIMAENDCDRELIMLITDEPIVDTERHGHWRKVDDKEPLAWDCSVCGAMCHYNTPYCPICGAKMNEE